MISKPDMFKVGVLIIVGMCTLVVSGVAGAEETSSVSSIDVNGPALLALFESTLVDVIARTEKSVVAIARVRTSRPGEVFNLEPRLDPFGGLAERSITPQTGDPNFFPTDYGAGVVVDSKGLILTVAQLIGEESEYYVTTCDRRTFRARVVAADPRSDLAVLSVPAEDLQPITLGNAALLKKGQIVIALGNPYAIAKDGQVCASWGIVSNLGRKAPPMPTDRDPTGKPTIHHFGTLIQTDAKLGFSSNGGALVNLKGEMVGLLTTLPVATGYETPAGYAYPVDETFLRVLNHLKRGEEVEYGLLGIQPESLSLAERASGLQGTRIDRVVPGTPADRVGLRGRDLLVAVNGEPLYDDDGLVLAVGRLPVDSKVTLDVVRDRRRFQVQAVLTKYPVRGRKIVTAPPQKWRGITVDYVSAVSSSPEGFWQFPRPTDAVAVVAVEENSPAWKAGLRPGAFISHIETEAVTTPKVFYQVAAKYKGPVRLRLVPDGSENYQPVLIIEP
ncbi:MAG TPA: trypsin-like peptidase domain-containing protein [Thermogutta sp.]|nr:trypsin-like peptidase domain-containing protein [Thermogutta sp.]HQF13970.1 trypsin-like peptidase domain-containing protein [Thermogutta sp.]